MGIAISDDHLELSNVAEAFLANTGALAEARSLLDAPEETLPAAWKEMADLGWLGLHLPEAHGGSGFGLAERRSSSRPWAAVVAPGPFVPTVWASSVIAACGSDAQQAELLPGWPTVRSAPRSASTTARTSCSARGSPTSSSSPPATTSSSRRVTTSP